MTITRSKIDNSPEILRLAPRTLPAPYTALTSRPQPVGLMERAVAWLLRRELPRREEEWVSRAGVLWYRSPGGTRAPWHIERLLDSRIHAIESGVFERHRASRAT